MGEKLKLYGFNNLTKALSFNIYDVCYAKTPREQRDYLSYIDEQYNSERLTKILTTLTDMIGAKVLNIARQDYDPQGASVTILLPKKRWSLSAKPSLPIWTKAMLPSIPIRSIIRKPALQLSVWTLTSQPVAQSHRFPPSITSLARLIRTSSPWITAFGDSPAMSTDTSCF